MHLRSLRRLRPLIDIYSYLPLKNKPSYVAHPEIILIFAHIINVVLYELCRSDSTGYKGTCDK